MAEIYDDTRIQTLKRMMSVAKKLVESESNEIFELAHHIADNVLNKVSMLIGIEKNRKDLVYYNVKTKKTREFNFLYKEILEKFYPNVPKYNDIIRKYHRGRNTYNHDIISLDFSIRKPSAINYIKCVEDILREVGYLGKDETIESSTLISHAHTSPLIVSENEQLAEKYKKLYDRLASRNPEHVIIDVRTLVEEIGKINLGKILRLEYVPEGEDRIMLIEPKKWNLTIRTGSYRHLRLIKYLNGDSPTYDFEFPDKNEDILNEFLDLMRNRCKEQGISLN